MNYGYNDLLAAYWPGPSFDIIAYDWYSDMGDLDNTSSCIPAAGCSRPGPGTDPLTKLLTVRARPGWLTGYALLAFSIVNQVCMALFV